VQSTERLRGYVEALGLATERQEFGAGPFDRADAARIANHLTSR